MIVCRLRLSLYEILCLIRPIDSIGKRCFADGWNFFVQIEKGLRETRFKEASVKNHRRFEDLGNEFCR